MRLLKKILGGILVSALLLLNFSANAQNIQISGTVTDSNDGSPMIGVSVVIKGTQIGAITNVDGKYTINGDSNGTIQFSFIGYVLKEEAINSRSVIDASLAEDVEQIEEVVVVGYGTLKKSDRTGAVYNVKAEDLNRGSLQSPVQAIQGKIAGVNVTKKGGDPNSDFSIQIRGQAGLSSDSKPLYVIDGIPGADMSTVSPEDIESFNVLKDASSGAIYGSRASNGVIIVTTKKGKKGDGVTIDYNGYVSMDQTAKRLDMLTASDIRKYVADKGITNFVDGGGNTDWQDEIYRTGISQSHNIAVSNATDNMSYRLSFNHNDIEGVIIETEKQIDNARFNMTQKALNNRLTIDASLSGTFEHNNYVDYGDGKSPKNLLYQMFQHNPTDPVYNADGSYYQIVRDFEYNNPVALAKLLQNERDAKRLSGMGKISYEVIDGLVASANFGYFRNDYETYYYRPTNLYSTTSAGYGKREYNNTQSRTLETLLTYTKSFGDHNVSALLGYSYQDYDYTGFYVAAENALSDYLAANNLGHLQTIVGGNSSYVGSWRNSSIMASFFGRATYNFQQKYYATVTLRRDGSSKFGDNNEWGFFPSASVAWDIKKESFLENVEVVNMLKLRAGFGITGNQEFSNNVDIMTFSPTGTAPNFETGENSINFGASHNANPDLKWEENREYNIGLDFATLSNRIQGSIEYYNKQTSDLIAQYSVPVPPNATSTTWANAGQIDNQGIEISVEGFVMDKKDFKWRTQLNFAHNKQKLVSLSSSDGTFTWSESEKKKLWLSGRGLVGSENWVQYLQEGEEIGTFYLPEYAGLSSDGKFLFYTAAGGVTRNLENAERRILGHAQPKFTMGWSNHFSYKNFDLSIALRGSYGNDVFNGTKLAFGNPNNGLPTLGGLKDMLDEADRGLTSTPVISDYYLEDGSFIKIDNITLAYNFDVANLGFIKRLRLYVTSNNVYTFTNYSGLDPETSYNGTEFGLDQYDVYPKTRTFTFGLDLKF